MGLKTTSGTLPRSAKKELSMIRVLMAMALAAVFATPAMGQAPKGGDEHTAQHAPAAAPSAMAEGEVRKVDRDAQKVTLRHGPIAALDMPPMTMVFRVKDPAMLEKLKAGDRIRFRAEKVQGAYTVTEFEPIGRPE